MTSRAIGPPPSIPPGQCWWSSYAGGYGVGCNFDQAEKALLQAFVPFMVGIDVLFLLLGLCLCAFGAKALAWLPATTSTLLARRSTTVRLAGAVICIIALGQFAATAEVNESLAGRHSGPLRMVPLGMVLEPVGLPALLVLLSRSRKVV